MQLMGILSPSDLPTELIIPKMGMTRQSGAPAGVGIYCLGCTALSSGVTPPLDLVLPRRATVTHLEGRKYIVEPLVHRSDSIR